MKIWVWNLSKMSTSGGWNGVSKKPEVVVPHDPDVEYWLNTGLFYQLPSVFSFASQRKWLSKRSEE